jgi:response regulator RpfG family c-di-GMP phosphodiesterase
MDCQMPEMDGLVATGVIRKAQSLTGKRTPIVAMTAHAMEGDRERCIAAGMDDYLSKPIDPDQLRQVIDKWLPNSVHVALNARPGATTDRTTPIDITALSQRYGEKHVERFIQSFVEAAPKLIDEIKQMFAAKNEVGVLQSAHGLNGICASLYANNMRRICLEIEAAGREKNWTALASLIEQLDSEFNDVEEFLQATFEIKTSEDRRN